jgi:D-alanyl-D-alanine endopeptidase (penicillin-binding protein 7)
VTATPSSFRRPQIETPMRPLHHSRRGVAALVLALALPSLAYAPDARAAAASGTIQRTPPTAAPAPAAVRTVLPAAAQPVAKTATQPVAKTAAKPAAQPVAKPAAKPAARSAVQPGAKRAAKPASPGKQRAKAAPPVSIAGGPPLHSRAALVFDPNSGAVLYGRRPDAVLPIASITKLMTALVVVEAGQPLDELITISEEDANGTAKSGSRLPVGTTLTRAELLQLALMASDNRAAYALCRNYPRGYPHCIAAMRYKGVSLGMTRTSILEPTGLSSNNVSTPEDLSKLVRAAAHVPLIQRYSTAPSLVVPVRGRLVEFRNTDRLVLDPEFGVRVSKTGYINEAGRCLVLQVELSGRPYVIVLLNARGPAARTADARTLRRWLETKVAGEPAGPVQAAMREPAAGAIESTASLATVF